MEVFIEYKAELVEICRFFTLPFLTFLIALGSVYLVGRMWELVSDYKTKNKLASLALLLSYVLYFNTMAHDTPLRHKIWYITLYMSISIIFYVVIGFKLYDRMEALLDKWTGYNTKNDKNKKNKK